MPSREDVDDVLQRIGLVAISYHPEIHVDDGGVHSTAPTERAGLDASRG